MSRADFSHSVRICGPQRRRSLFMYGNLICNATDCCDRHDNILNAHVWLQTGQLYNAEDGRKALRDIFALGLFDNVQARKRKSILAIVKAANCFQPSSVTSSCVLAPRLSSQLV